MFRILIGCLMLVIAVPLVGTILYLIHGSLELVPTEEQEEKVKVVLGTITIMLISVEIGLGFLLITFKRK